LPRARNRTMKINIAWQRLVLSVLKPAQTMFPSTLNSLRRAAQASHNLHLKMYSRSAANPDFA